MKDSRHKFEWQTGCADVTVASRGSSTPESIQAAITALRDLANRIEADYRPILALAANAGGAA